MSEFWISQPSDFMQTCIKSALHIVPSYATELANGTFWKENTLCFVPECYLHSCLSCAYVIHFLVASMSMFSLDTCYL